MIGPFRLCCLLEVDCCKVVRSAGACRKKLEPLLSASQICGHGKLKCAASLNVLLFRLGAACKIRAEKLEKNEFGLEKTTHAHNEFAKRVKELWISIAGTH